MTNNPGTQYVIEQLGEALQASHQLINQQAQRIAQLEAERDDLLRRPDLRQVPCAQMNPQCDPPHPNGHWVRPSDGTPLSDHAPQGGSDG